VANKTANIEQVPRGWRARWRTPDGVGRSKTFRLKVDAQRHLTTIENSKITGAYIDPLAGRVLFRDYAEKWRKIQVHRPSTAAQVETNLRRHAYPAFGERPIGVIRPSEIQAWVHERKDVLSPRTVELVFRYVQAIFLAAVDDKLIAHSPAMKIKLPEPERRTKSSPLTRRSFRRSPRTSRSGIAPSSSCAPGPA